MLNLLDPLFLKIVYKSPKQQNILNDNSRLVFLTCSAVVFPNFCMHIETSEIGIHLTQPKLNRVFGPWFHELPASPIISVRNLKQWYEKQHLILEDSIAIKTLQLKTHSFGLLFRKPLKFVVIEAISFTIPWRSHHLLFPPSYLPLIIHCKFVTIYGHFKDK